MRKTIGLVVVLGLSMSLLAGCGGENGKKGGTEGASKDVVDTPSKITAVKSILEEVEPAIAKALYRTYKDQFRLDANGNLLPDETIRVGFSIDDVQLLYESLQRNKATGVNVYFGAAVADGKIQKTVFFQPAMYSGTNNGHKDYDDIPFSSSVKPHDVGHPCPPPKCNGKTNYPD